MHFTDIFIRRPVLATVVSLMILVLGLRSYGSLPVLQFPRTENTVVTVTTTFYGADPDVIAGFITTPLENAIAQANGIDYMTSTSTPGVSTITVNLRLNYEADKALTEISTKVTSVLNQLPPGSQQPTLTVKVGQSIDAMYIGFSSDVLSANKITDYLIRVVQPKLQAVPGVQTAELLGSKVFALRAWLDPNKLTAYGLTGTDVTQALAGNDYIAGLGTTKGQMVQVSLTASTGLHTVEEFKNLIVKQTDTALVRLRDVANVVLGAEDYKSEVGFDGKKAVYIGIQVAPAANLLDVIKGVRAVFPAIVEQLPQGLLGEIVYDSTEFVNSAIDEVIRSLLEALAIVTLVVFAFLGSVRSALIPTIAIPLSLVGTFTIMLALGYSINLLTLLALVLGDRARCRRRHHRGGKRQPPSRGGDGADPRCYSSGARARRADHRHDGGAGRRLCADRLPGRLDRRPVRGVRLHAGRRRDGVGRDRAHAVADDVFAASERPRRCRTGKAGRLRGPGVRPAAPPLCLAAAWQLELSAGHDRVRGHHPRQHLFPLCRCQDRTRSRRGPGRHHQPVDLGPRFHAAAAPDVWAPGL